MANPLYNIPAGSSITIAGRQFAVSGYIEFRQGSFSWKEYALDDGSGTRHWMSVEKNQNINGCQLFRPLDKTFPEEKLLIYQGQEYARSDSGNAVVIGCDGDCDAATGDKVYYADYQCVQDSNLLLSMEHWEGGTIEYSEGIFFPKDEIQHTGGAATPDIDLQKKIPFSDIDNLSPGQKIRIRGDDYTITGRARMRQQGFEWTEYQVESGFSAPKWLSVELTDGSDYALGLHSNVSASSVDAGPKQVTYKGKVYGLMEQGSGIVYESIGKGDYDPNEHFSFTEYEADDGSMLSREQWVDEVEFSHGEPLQHGDVEILAGKKKPLYFINAWAMVFVAVAIALVAGIIWFISYMGNPTIARQLKTSAQFEYVTTVTQNDSRNTKADIYSTAKTLDEACKAIIDMDPERIEYVSTESEDTVNGERMVRTKREVVVIYEGEEGDTYVQVCNTEVEEQAFSTYRPRYRTRLHRFYGRSNSWYASGGTSTGAGSTSAYNIDTGQYTSYVGSARQASINARQSSGGGTGFGK